MNIAIDVSPLSSGHKVRGVGFYLNNLLDGLATYAPHHTYLRFTANDGIPEKADLVHYPYFDPFFLTLPVRFKKPTIITIHDLTPLKFPLLFPPGKKGMLRWQIQKRLAKNAAAVITDSENSKKDIHQILRIPIEHVQRVYLAAGREFKPLKLTTKQTEELRRKYHLPEKFVLYVGDVTPNKNLPILLDAIELLNVPLVMVGKALASKEYDRTNALNRDLITIQQRAQKSVSHHILGFVPQEDLVSLYNAASVFVMPSFYEGFGLPLLEAMSCGTPSITTEESSLPEVGGDAVLYAKHSDAQDLAEKIKIVIEDKDLARKLSTKGLEQAKKFSWEKTANETVGVYERILR